MSLFVNMDPMSILPQMVADFESYTGVTLREGDQRRQMLQGFAYVLTGVLQNIEHAGLQNLLQYSSGENLDKLGELVGVYRLPAQASQTTMQFTLSGVQSQTITIPQGTRVTPDGTTFFATVAPLIILSGNLSGTVTASAVEVGSGYDGYLSGQIATLVDGIPFVETVRNLTTSEGGTDIEADEALRERIRQAPFSFSTAGPNGAYRFFALSASADVGDVYVTQLSPGTVGIYVVKVGGKIPEPDDPVIAAVEAACSSSDRRPLTDYVQVAPAVAVNTEITAQYWISEENKSRTESIQAAVATAVEEYKSWQTKQIGRYINPDELRKRMLNAGATRIALASPVYQELTAEQVAQFSKTEVTYQGVE